MQQPRAFVDRFLEHLDKIDSAELEHFILRAVAQRDFYARIFETLTEGIVIVDGEFRVTLVNTAARRILRWSTRRKIVNEPLLDLLNEGALRQLAESYLHDPRAIQNEDVTLAGHPNRLYTIHILPILESREDETSTRGAALILQDITAARDRQARTAQAEKIASLVTLTAGVAHEIKNPLNSLSIHAQLLERAAADLSSSSFPAKSKTIERIARSCDVIHEEIERLRKCVDDFIDAARPRRPNFALHNLNAIVETVLDMAALEFEERAIQVETYLDPDVPALPLDERQIFQALRHLVRNAVEAIDTARRPRENRRLTVRTDTADDVVTLEIADTGCGISADNLPKVFEPYFTTKFNGSGLGLMAVGRIIREHGGFITVNSAEGEGTTFTIDLPLLNPRVKLLENGSKRISS